LRRFTPKNVRAVENDQEKIFVEMARLSLARACVCVEWGQGIRLRRSVKIRESKLRQKVDSAASAILMSASGEGPERLAEILREIIGLTKTARTNVPDIKSREVVESANVQKLNIESPGALDAQGRPRD
jgi:hypothetical protein